jgi:hypothetical protein
VTSAICGAVSLLFLRFFAGLLAGWFLDLKADDLYWAGLPWLPLSPESSQALTAPGLVLWVLFGFGVYSLRN